MVELGFYEKVIKAQNTWKLLLYKITIIAVYTITTILLFISALFNATTPALAFVLIAILSLALYIILPKISPEYEYCISETSITLAKIYGKSRRKEIFEAPSGSILFIAPKNETNMKKALDYHPTEQYDIYTSSTDCGIWLAVFENEDEEKTLFVFEAEDSATKILRVLKPSAMTFR